MNPYVTSEIIKKLREKRKMTQQDLAKILNVSNKTISKWETGKGLPDISLLQPLANAFSISVAELLQGFTVENKNVCCNVKRSIFYICPICGNVIHAMGQTSISCHGIPLTPLVKEKPDEHHLCNIELIEDDLFIHLDHPMTKDHFISFIAAISINRIQMVKLYPEGPAECRFPRRDISSILYYCNKDGLFEEKLQ